MKFGPVNPELTELICERHVWHDQKTGALSDISGYTGPIFAIFSPYESALRVDDGSVPYFPICQGTLPWQPNNVVKMLSTSTCIRCTSARKRIAISWSSCGDDGPKSSKNLVNFCLITTEMTGLIFLPMYFCCAKIDLTPAIVML